MQNQQPKAAAAKITWRGTRTAKRCRFQTAWRVTYRQARNASENTHVVDPA